MTVRTPPLFMHPHTHKVYNWKTKPRLKHTCLTTTLCRYWHV